MWTTASEIDFIKGIGTFSIQGKGGLYSRKELLSGYISSCQLRAKWGSIDRSAVMDFAKMELAKILA